MNGNTEAQFELNFSIFLSSSMTGLVVAALAFEGHSEPLKQVELLHGMWLPSVSLSLGVARGTGGGSV